MQTKINVKKPRVKRGHNPVKLRNGSILVGGQYPIAKEVSGELARQLWELLPLLDGSRTVSEVLTEVSRLNLKLQKSDAEVLIGSLWEEGFLEEGEINVPSELSRKEIERYDRNLQYFSWVDNTPRSSIFDLQLALKNASVTIIGVGGGGSSVLTSLVMAGVGKIHIVDFDYVELSNLNRQFLFDESDIGRKKVDVAVEKLSRMNSNVNLIGTNKEMKSVKDLREVIANKDLFILTADKPLEIRDWANEAALSERIPWLTASYMGPMIVVGGFIPYVTGCANCAKIVNKDRNKDRVEYLLDASNQNAVIAPNSILVGQFTALEAIYYLTGLKTQTMGRFFHLNAMEYDHVYYVEIPRLRDCRVCSVDKRNATQR